jgi:hypothetical protein
VRTGDVVALKCECGILDDDLFEIVHDAECPLADVDCESRTTDVTRLKQLGAKT